MMKKRFALFLIVLLVLTPIVSASFWNLLFNRDNQITGNVIGTPCEPYGDDCSEIGIWCNIQYGGETTNHVCCEYGKNCCLQQSDCVSGATCIQNVCYDSGEGTLSAGDTCNTYEECGPGLTCNSNICCDAYYAMTSEGVCCRYHGSCLSGYECGSENHCVECSDPSNCRAQEGESCYYSNDCGEGLTCNTMQGSICISEGGSSDNSGSDTTSDCASGCPSSYLGDGECDSACNVYACNYDNGDCDTNLNSEGEYCSYSSECDSSWCSNNVCCDSGYTCCDDDLDCSTGYVCGINYYCEYDYDSYDSETAGCDFDSCPESWLADGTCDSSCNNLACNYDNGDCGRNSNGESCSENEDCTSGWCDSEICCAYDEWCCTYDSDCGSTDDKCIDNYCQYQSEDCAVGCPDSYLADGYCDTACNVYECNYDNGDCGTTTTTTSTPSYAPSTYTNLYAPTIDDEEKEEMKEKLKDNLKSQKVDPENEVELRIGLSPYPLPENLNIYLDEEINFYVTIENAGNMKTEVVYYSVTLDDSSTSYAELQSDIATSSTISRQLGNLKVGEVHESYPFTIRGKSYGSTGLTIDVFYSDAEGVGQHEYKSVPVTVYSTHLNEQDAATAVFGEPMMDLGEYLSSLIIKEEGVEKTLYDVKFVKPLDLGKMTKEWNHYASHIAYYKGKVADDVTGTVSPGVVEFMSNVKDVSSQQTYEETENSALRAVTPSAIKIGWDLGRLTRNVEKIKEEDANLKRQYSFASFGWTSIDGQKTRIMYIEGSSGTTYAVKLGVI